MGSQGPSIAFLGAPESHCAVFALDHGVGGLKFTLPAKQSILRAACAYRRPLLKPRQRPRTYLQSLSPE